MKKLFLSLAILLFAGSVHAQQLINLISQYTADQQMMSRKYPLKFAPAYFLRMDKFYTDWKAKLSKLPYNSYGVNDRVDYQLLKRLINMDLSNLKRSEFDQRSVVVLLNWTQIVESFQLERSVGKVIIGDQLKLQLEDIQERIKTISSGIRQGDNKNSPAEFAVAERISEQYRRALMESYKFYEGYDPAFTAIVKGPYNRADAALKAFVELLGKQAQAVKQKDDGSGIVGNPIGRDGLIRGLADEMIAYTPEQLQKIALEEFAWCDKEMLKASREMGFGDNWRAALEKVKLDYVPQGKQPELIKFLAEEATDYVINNNLVTVPPMAREGWSMRMLSAQEQLTAPFFLGGESILIAYPTDGMTDTAKMMSLRGNNKHFARATVHHELIPGHNLQYYMQNRYKTYRRPFGTPFWTEGWALYWEMLLWDRGFAKSPENRIGMLFWRMHRCARIIFSTNYHLGIWTPQQCIDFLVERVGFERANAEAEVRRSFTGNYGPLYQVAYMLGGLQFRALHKELVGSGKMSNKEFHDQILQNNAMPVELVRAVISKTPLPENYQTQWKFAGAMQ